MISLKNQDFAYFKYSNFNPEKLIHLTIAYYRILSNCLLVPLQRR